MNQNHQKKTWFLRHWKWLTPLILLMVFFVLSIPESIKITTAHIARGYTDTEIPEKALEIVRKSERVKEMLGELEPIGKMTILEGYVKYSKNADSVLMALNVKGTKGKGKMDIMASKNSGTWEYDTLRVRLKEPKFRKETIPVLP